MPELNVRMTDEERAFLGELLEKTLKNVRVEEHRTRAPNAREVVLHQERIIASLMGKIGWNPA